MRPQTVTADLFLTKKKKMQCAFLKSSPHTQIMACIMPPHPGVVCLPPLASSYPAFLFCFVVVSFLAQEHVRTQPSPSPLAPELCATSLGHPDASPATPIYSSNKAGLSLQPLPTPLGTHFGASPNFLYPPQRLFPSPVKHWVVSE